MNVTSLTTYPIKSTAGIYSDEILVRKEGLDFDRNWVLIDDEGVAITGRQNAQMLAFSSDLFSDHLLVRYRSEHLKIPFDISQSSPIAVKVFSSTGYGIEQSDEISDWFSSKLNQPCRIVVFDPNAARQIQEKHGGSTGEIVKFADMNPILLISQASLKDLNDKLENPVSMRNFRPNIVIDGCEAFAEDAWKKIQIGECTFKVVQQCERCVFTTINPDTYEKSKDSEPLKTLSKYRRTPSGGVAFGMHLIPEKLGTLKKGDSVTILS